MESCKFCKLMDQVDNPDHIVSLEFGKVYLNWNQIYLGRVMYVFKEHLRDITEIGVPDLRGAEAEIHKIACVIRQEFSADLMNVASLGNHVQHLHWHIIPRYKADVNWGNAPWPHEDRFPDDDEKRSLVQRIRKHF